jgi:hypothetical protein
VYAEDLLQNAGTDEKVSDDGGFDHNEFLDEV